MHTHRYNGYSSCDKRIQPATFKDTPTQRRTARTKIGNGWQKKSPLSDLSPANAISIHTLHGALGRPLSSPGDARTASGSGPTLTRLLVGDFVEAILKHFVEMVMFIIASSHFDISSSTVAPFSSSPSPRLHTHSHTTTRPRLLRAASVLRFDRLLLLLMLFFFYFSPSRTSTLTRTHLRARALSAFTQAHSRWGEPHPYTDSESPCVYVQ